jgi:hypothetical protein
MPQPRPIYGAASGRRRDHTGNRAGTIGPVYARGIVYGTPKQITADWLRDQIRLGPVDHAVGGTPRPELMARCRRSRGPMMPGLHAALVDEADAVLIDEGVVPLIIARSRREDDMAEGLPRGRPHRGQARRRPRLPIDQVSAADPS